MSIRKKVLAGFFLVSLLGLTLGFTGLTTSQKLASKTNELKSYSEKSNKFTSIMNAHHEWRIGLLRAIMTGTEFRGSLDPETCALGNWLTGEESKNETDGKILNLLNTITAPHNYIHYEASKAINLLNGGDKVGAEDFLINQIMPRFDEVITNLTAINSRLSELVNERETDVATIASNNVSITLVIIVVVLALSFTLALYISGAISRSVNALVIMFRKAEQGDMTARSGLKQKDEIGIIANAADQFFIKLQGIIKDIHMYSGTLAGASEELSAISRRLSSAADGTVNQATTTAGTMEQMSVNINTIAGGAEEASVCAREVASAAEQMSGNMETISAEIAEMGLSISQISSNAGEARRVTVDATQKASEATDVMNKLGASAKEIGHVTDIIKKIADKTNLLALNATIEAAGAGEAGKGFAVVAGEIKELAKQSAQSADDIARRIEGIQLGTENAVGVITTVSGIIRKINTSVETIANKVIEQNRAVGEISTNVMQANIGAKRVASAIGEVANGANDVSQNAGEAEKGAAHVSSNIISMSMAARKSLMGADQVNQSSKDLSFVATNLKGLVSQFRV